MPLTTTTNPANGGEPDMHQNQPQPSKHYFGITWWGVIAAIAVIVIVIHF